MCPVVVLIVHLLYIWIVLCVDCVEEICLFLLFRVRDRLSFLLCYRLRPILNCLSLDLGRLLLDIDFSNLLFLLCFSALSVSFLLFRQEVLVRRLVRLGNLILLRLVLVAVIFLPECSLLPKWLVLLLLSIFPMFLWVVLLFPKIGLRLLMNVLMLTVLCCMVNDSGQKISSEESIQTVFHYSVWQKALCFILATLA